MRKRLSVLSAIAMLAACVALPAHAGLGGIDATFGNMGRVAVAGNSGPHVFERPDGRILVAGPADGLYGHVASNLYLPNGDADVAYGSGGRSQIQIADYLSQWMPAAAMQPDGRLVIAGADWMSDGVSGSSSVPYAVRVDTAGVLDRTFAGGVLRGYMSGVEPQYTSMVVMPGGEVVAAISDWTSDRLDRFSPDGRYLGSLGGYIAPMWLALHQDGRLLVSGYHRLLHSHVVVLIDATGQLDRTFGAKGSAVLADGYDGALAVDPIAGTILACGRAGIARLTTQGELDTTFGDAGTGYVEFGGAAAPSARACVGLVPLKDGGVAYVAARTTVAGDEVLVGALTGSGAADTRFGDGSGFQRIELGPVSARFEVWDTPSRVTTTRDGNALLTWRSFPWDGTLQLARLDLGGSAAYSDPPTSSAPNPPQPPDDPPPPPPPPPPGPTPEPSAGSGHGGGGSIDCGFGLLLVLCAAAARRRLHH